MNPRQRLLSFACAKLAVTASCLRSLRNRPPVCSMRHREPHEGEVSEALPWLHSAAGPRATIARMRAMAYLEGLTSRGVADAAGAVRDLLLATAMPESDAEALAHASASMPRTMRAAVLVGIAWALPRRGSPSALTPGRSRSTARSSARCSTRESKSDCSTARCSVPMSTREPRTNTRCERRQFTRVPPRRSRQTRLKPKKRKAEIQRAADETRAMRPKLRHRRRESATRG